MNNLIIYNIKKIKKFIKILVRTLIKTKIIYHIYSKYKGNF